MSAPSNDLGQIATINPLDGFYALQQCCENMTQLKQRLQDIDTRIEFWKKVADKENIDISLETDCLECIKSTEEEKKTKKDSIFSLLLIERRKDSIRHRIVCKVRGNIRREPLLQVSDTVKKKLSTLSREKTIPWVVTAKALGVDIAEELQVMKEANRSSLEKLKETKVNYQHTLEVVQRRLQYLRTQCTSRIILKTYIQYIQDLADEVKSRDWFDERRTEVVEGIAKDAKRSLPSAKSLVSIEKECGEVLGTYKKNLELYEENPEKYFEMADREWLRRNIIQYSAGLIAHALSKKKGYIANQIRAVERIALARLQTNEKTESIQEAVNHTFDLFAEQICGRT